MLVTAPVRAEPPSKSLAKDNEELAQLFRADQDDRKAADIDWSIVEPRDRKREARVKELYRDNRLQTGADYYHTAMILQHGRTPEDYLLAHELCIVAISKGEERASWLAAASEDRFLMNIGRPQRFGTQSRTEGPDGQLRLYKVGPGVTDELRRALGVPPLKEAEARAAKMNEKLKKAKKP
jgi:hypothetical protein